MTARRASLFASPITAIAALLVFGSVHAWWIVPIWDRLAGGLPFVLVGSLGVAWFYGELLEAVRLPRPALVGGTIFGVGAWLTMLPPTALMLLFRATGFHAAHDNWETTFEILASALTGALVGWALLRHRRAVLSGAAAAVVLMLVQAGPVPLLNGRRPMGLFLLLAAIYALCGAVQATVTAVIIRRRGPPATA